MEEKRIGRQTPTKSYTLPYDVTLGQDAVDIYEETGRTAQEWQKLLLYDILAINDDKLWTHTKFGYSVPRRNGKNEVVAIRELYGLHTGEHILHTAHRTTTSHAAWDRLCALLSASGLTENVDYKTTKQFGLERIEMLDGTDGKISFRTRSSKGGLGEGFDLLIIDEAQEYQDDQETALKYVVTDSKNPQTIFCGTPPTPVSSGTVFTKLRKSTLAGETEDAAWEEWSVDEQSDVHDRDLWYETNPSLGTVFTERSVANEVGEDDIDFNIQRLGLWIRYNQHSAISATEWEELTVETVPEIVSRPSIGIKYNHNGQSVSLSIAAKTADGRIFAEGVDCCSVSSGTAWITSFIKDVNPKSVIVDGANGQKLLEDAMKAEHLKAPTLPTVKDVIAASTMFEQGIFSKTICHSPQPSMLQAVSNCEHRAIGSGGGFGYSSIREGVDISLLDSLVLAIWSANEPEKQKQKVSY